ncbi:hypothetical protein K4F52_001925 [Lecanicillium sp. MT-2017a]|nr:hypothetical protein K4F52_001925 [Lecanicillium sp. MT-2017a]
MPRASGSGKRQSGGGHRDARHENGLVGPGKRASGRKSQGQSSASAKAANAAASDSTSAVATANIAGQSLNAAQLNGASNGSASKQHGQTQNQNQGNTDSSLSDPKTADAMRRGSVDGDSETSTDSASSQVGPNANANANANTNGAPVDSAHRQIDVNALKNSDVHRDSSFLEMAATVLKSLPMQDTLAILIILMQVPSLSLSFIYAIFTCLTFVPPVTTSSGMNINLAEIFDGNSTMPSLVTVACMDFFFLLIWLFLWQPLQDAVLDFAKPVIAITLGGGSSQRDGSSRGITTCFTWVVIHHVLRGTRSHWSHLVPDVPQGWQIPGLSASNSASSSNGLHDKRSAYAWVRSCLAIHILTQGIVRYVREWYLRREKATASSSSSNDPEAGKHGTQPSSGDPANDGPALSPDLEPTPSPALQPPTAKKRRKQSAQVRLQQPLWAALASTKIVVMKEYELSHTASESLGANATDIHNLGNAPFDRQPAQIWISYIGSDEICFNTSYFPPCESVPPPAAREQNGHAGRPSSVDTTKPFYVRVNNAFWQPTRMHPVQDAEEDCPEGSRWTGDIYGLRPASKYVCDFVDTRTDKVIFTANVRTVKEPLRSKDGGSPAVSNGPQSLRPDSPVTTLKTSISASSEKLAEEKNKLKTWRKEWKNRLNTLKRENELTDNQLASAGNSDEKYRQKIRQQETQKAQAERDTQQLSEQAKGVDAAPERVEQKKKIERSFSAEKKLFDAAQRDFTKHKAKLDSELKEKEVEKSNLNTKRNKIATRIAKVDNELVNLTDANNRGLNEAERKKQERTTWLENNAAIESNYTDRIADVCAGNATRAEHVRSLQAQLQGLRSYLHAANGGTLDSDPGLAPFPPPQQGWTAAQAQAYAGNGYWMPSASAGEMPLSVTAAPMMAPGMAWNHATQPGVHEPVGGKSRGRSSSMLSDVSGFTASSDGGHEGSPRFAHRSSRYAAGHRGSGMNGSSGSSGSGSGGPTSPI